jgi:ABC-type antimicrobial peptide transport system permease subunit
MIAFAAVALTLAVLGVYAVTAYSVGERLRELGIRLALGAQRYQIAGSVLAHGLALAVGAVFLGGFAAPMLTRSIGPLLFEVERHDAVTLIGGAVAVTVAALLACLLPALRAARADAASLLRSE